MTILSPHVDAQQNLQILWVGLHSRNVNFKHAYEHVDDQLNPGFRFVFKLYLYNCRPGLSRAVHYCLLQKATQTLRKKSTEEGIFGIVACSIFLFWYKSLEFISQNGQNNK